MLRDEVQIFARNLESPDASLDQRRFLGTAAVESEIPSRSPNSSTVRPKRLAVSPVEIACDAMIGKYGDHMRAAHNDLAACGIALVSRRNNFDLRLVDV